MSKLRRFAITSTLIILSFVAGWHISRYQLTPHHGSIENLQENLCQSPLLDQVLQSLNQSYLNREKLKDQKKLIYGAISGLVSSLGDPYTVFLPPEQNKEFQEDMAGSFGGVGIQLGYKEKQLTVIAPLEGTPADRAGIKAGDIIVHIKDEKKGIDQDTYNLSLPEAVNIIRGPKGSIVELTVRREGEREPITVAITRGEIKVPSVELEMVAREDKNIAHLKLIRFGDQTEKEWDEAVRKIVAKQKDPSFAGVILDLRNNPGGYLESAVEIASEFISQGVIVQQESKNNQKKALFASGDGHLFNTPLVVLVNGGSASASEIVAGALRQQRGAKIVGETTFGKGTVQEAKSLLGGAGIHITVARWLLPNGESIHEKGIEPDIIVKNNPEENKDLQLEKAIDLLLGK